MSKVNVKCQEKPEDFDYFRNKAPLRHRCGERGVCAICGKKSTKHYLGLGLISQFHFCSRKHQNMFEKWLSEERERIKGGEGDEED